MASADFARDGFLGPLPLLTAPQCRALLRQLTSDECPAPAVWEKGRAVTDWRLSGLAADPRLLELLTPILGDDIVLWGCSLVKRTPGQIHRWHVDIESSAPDGRFVTLWMGLQNTSSASSVRLIAGSHLCGKTIQQFQTETGCSWQESSTEKVLAWARSANPDARLVDPDLSDGEAILFDGRMWHGSHNRQASGVRWALLLQFAASDSPVRMPDRRVATWPFKFLDTPPPAVVVQGTAMSAANVLVPPPKRPVQQPLPALRSSIRRLELPLAEDREEGWRSYPFFRGSTPALDLMSCHAAVLSAGHSPHPPHAHPDEELLIVLDGEAELLVADGPAYDRARAVPVKAGDFAFYPPLQHHTIRNPGDSPVTYLMFRWRRPGAQPVEKRLKTTVFRAPAEAQAVQGRGFATRRIFEAPTRWLRKLHCHTTRLEVGAGYAPHADPYDIAILVQSGRVSTLRQEVGPGGLIYCPAGDMHGMRNIGDEPAQYIVFEFHGAPQPADRPNEGATARLAPAPWTEGRSALLARGRDRLLQRVVTDSAVHDPVADDE